MGIKTALAFSNLPVASLA